MGRWLTKEMLVKVLCSSSDLSLAAQPFKFHFDHHSQFRLLHDPQLCNARALLQSPFFYFTLIWVSNPLALDAKFSLETMSFVTISQAFSLFFLSVGLVEIAFTIILIQKHKLKSKKSTRSTPIFIIAYAALIPFLVAFLCDLYVLAAVVSINNSSASPGRSLIESMFVVNQVGLIAKLFSFVFVGVTVLWRVYLFCGSQCVQFKTHLLALTVMILTYALASFYTIIVVTKFAGENVSFKSVYLGLINPRSLEQPPKMPPPSTIQCIGLLFIVAFAMELVLLLFGTMNFLIAIAKPKGMPVMQVLKLLSFRSEGIRLLAIVGVGFAKVILLATSPTRLIIYTSSTVFFLSSCQYPIELNLFLTTSFHTSRVIIYGKEEEKRRKKISQRKSMSSTRTSSLARQQISPKIEKIKDNDGDPELPPLSYQITMPRKELKDEEIESFKSIRTPGTTSPLFTAQDFETLSFKGIPLERPDSSFWLDASEDASEDVVDHIQSPSIEVDLEMKDEENSI